MIARQKHRVLNKNIKILHALWVCIFKKPSVISKIALKLQKRRNCRTNSKMGGDLRREAPDNISRWREMPKENKRLSMSLGKGKRKSEDPGPSKDELKQSKKVKKASVEKKVEDMDKQKDTEVDPEDMGKEGSEMEIDDSDGVESWKDEEVGEEERGDEDDSDQNNPTHSTSTVLIKKAAKTWVLTLSYNSPKTVRVATKQESKPRKKRVR
ncbi:uncharacterized protein LOC131059779 [Cryptomeria japonica]|uniref:uncharacterized protein LOC131059779 n=1 Tax=Cryptomeria japonica TaxID=3369 RepID=UPI0027DA622B|nr:uncharacterized protein LOC131059779 [Cryptomeria japonica]